LNLSDTEFVTRLIIGYLYTFLRDRNLYIPFATDEKPFYKIEGGYVPDPTVGKHRYVFSVDLASSYPSSMRAVNISPELKGPMLLGPEGVMLHEDHILAGYVPEEFKSAEFREKYTMAPNGATFLREKRGILPLMLDELYARRKQLKAEYLRLSKLAAEAPEGKIKDDLETQASAAKNADLAVKLILNSTYGALASDKFLFFDPDVAGAVTSTGRIALKRMGEYVMQLVNSRIAMLKSLAGYCKKFGIDRASVAPPDDQFPEFKGVFVAGDTDSNYVSVAPFIEHLTFSSDPTENEKGRLDFLVWFGDNIVQQSIDKAMQQVERDVNALVTGVIKADREIVSPAGIWVAKKKYSALVYDQEGAKYWPEFKNKTQGLTLIQGRTTEQVKEVLKEFMKLLLLNTPEEANQHLISHRDMFYELDPDSIAINASANGFEKYVDEDGFAKKVKSPETGKLQSPTQEGRAAINFNRLVRKYQKEETYGTLQDGARFRFVHLRLPNPVNDSVVGWPDEWPKLFEDIGLEKYIFRSRQFDKAVMGQCNALFKVMGFNPRIAEQLDLV
jgi:DNA polymerase elongation subunit (family B)